jgi:hypothetical protein
MDHGTDITTGNGVALATPASQCRQPLTSALTLRRPPPLHTQPGFCPVFQQLAEPINRPFSKRYDYIEATPLNEALNYPVVGEA